MPEGLIPDWAILGPFPNPEGPATGTNSTPRVGLDVDYLAPAGGEAAARELPATLGDATLRPATAGEDRGVDLYPLFPEPDMTVAYALARVDSAAGGPHVAHFGSDDTARVWVNGTEVHRVPGMGRGFVRWEDAFDVELLPGANTVLVKVENGFGGFKFGLELYPLDEYPAVAAANLRELRLDSRSLAIPAGQGSFPLAVQGVPPIRPCGITATILVDGKPAATAIVGGDAVDVPLPASLAGLARVEARLDSGMSASRSFYRGDWRALSDSTAAIVAGAPLPVDAALHPIARGMKLHLLDRLGRLSSAGESSIDALVALQAEAAALPGAFARLDEPGHRVLSFEGLPGAEADWPNHYLAWLPKGYATRAPEGGWPLLFFLHGAGERGDDPDVVRRTGLPKRLDEDLALGFVVISPQCPTESFWEVDYLEALHEDVRARFNVSDSHVAVTGLSMGGNGSWIWATERADKFAAVAPICGFGDVFAARRLRNTPVWAFHCADDNVVGVHHSDRMVAELRAAGGDVRYDRYPTGGHDSWTAAYATDELYTWLASHTAPPAVVPPNPRDAIDTSGNPATARLLDVPARRVACTREQSPLATIDRAIYRVQNRLYDVTQWPDRLSAAGPMELRDKALAAHALSYEAVIPLLPGAPEDAPGVIFRDEPASRVLSLYYEGSEADTPRVHEALAEEARARGLEPGEHRDVIWDAPRWGNEVLREIQVVVRDPR